MAGWRFQTRAIHVGQDPDPATGAVVVPIYQTSTYRQDAPGQHRGYEYSRTGNPTRTALETCLASLEEAQHGLALASGLAATATLLYLFQPGDHVLVADDVYGGTFRLFQRVLARYGLSFTFVDMRDPEAPRRALRDETRLVWIETPTNPLLRILDIRTLASLAHQAGARLAVDNTFASPYFQRPLTLGADFVVHSTTKYLGGHSDLVGGALLLNDPAAYEKLKFHQNAVGAIPGPMDCWLALRGLKTLGPRMEAHQANALLIATRLAQHPRVARVYYPGLPSDPGHALASRQMWGYSGMVSFELVGDGAVAGRLVRQTRLFWLAESLGGVESLIELPAVMTHASLEGSGLKIPPQLIRLSVGIEDGEDLWEDLSTALETAF